MWRNRNIAFAGLSALVFAAGCSRHGGPPNVLFITMDATRADRLGCYGWTNAVTPHLDRLAREGTRFTSASTVAPITLPAHATLLTGLHPPEHGLHINGQGRLPADVPTVTETFKQAGYRTGAFVAFQVLASTYGLNKAFDIYDEPPSDDSEDPCLFVPLQADDEPCLYRKADHMADSVLAWLERTDRKPWFAWVHFYDPHYPLHWNRKQVGSGFKDPYDAEVAFMDQQIGRLLAWLDQRGVARNTLVIAVADHGESLGDHGEPAHAFLLYGSTVRIPWIIRFPGRVPAGAVLSGSVSSVQVAPTLLDLAGLAPHPQLAEAWHRAAWVEGSQTTDPASRRDSLAPAIRKGAATDFVCYSETDQPYASYRWSPLRALRKGAWKFIRAPEDEVYDLAQDPQEAVNRIATSPGEAQTLSRLLAEREDLMPRRKAEDVYVNQAAWRRLASLGYLAGSKAENRNPAEDRTLPNPNRLIRTTGQSAAIRQALLEGRCGDDTLVQARQLVEAAPGAAQFHMDLANVLAARGDLAAAVQAAKDALRIEPEHSDFKATLAVFYARSGDLAQALDLFRDVYRQTPDYGRAKQNYFQALQDTIRLQLSTNAFDAAEKLVDEACRAAPGDPAWQVRRAWVLKQIGQQEEAVRALKAVLAEHPDNPAAKQMLSTLTGQP